MRKIILITLVLIFNSCTKEKNIENISTKDKKFSYETTSGEKIESYLTFINDGKQNSISDKELRLLIKLSNRKIKENLILPSSFKPLEYNIKQSAAWVEYEQKVILRIKIRISYQAKNRKGLETIDVEELQVFKYLNDNKFRFYQ